MMLLIFLTLSLNLPPIQSRTTYDVFRGTTMASHTVASDHALRNPGKPTQKAKKKSKQPRSDAHENTKNMLKSASTQNKEIVAGLIDDFFEYREHRIEEIFNSQTEDRRRSKDWIRRQVTSSAYAQATRAPNYWNGYQHEVHQELLEMDSRKCFFLPSYTMALIIS